jgi:type II secretory pathway pseudopilin PulG
MQQQQQVQQQLQQQKQQKQQQHQLQQQQLRIQRRQQQSLPQAAAAAIPPTHTPHTRGGGEWDISDADIEKFYAELTTGGKGGDPPKESVVGGLIVKFFHGEFTPRASSDTLVTGRAHHLATSARRTSQWVWMVSRCR